MKYFFACALFLLLWASDARADPIDLVPAGDAAPRTLTGELDEHGQATWWLPHGADAYVLPITAGIRVDADDQAMQRWLLEHAPFHLLELPAFGAEYGGQTLTVIVPWPHYAELVVDEDDAGRFRVGVRFTFPEGRRDATPCEIVAVQQPASELAVAHAFRAWRATAEDLGSIPPPISLTEKAAANPHIARLFGAPHFYLWGPGLFSRHDVKRRAWVGFAQALCEAPADSAIGRMAAGMSEAQRAALQELAAADWPMDYLTREIAGGIEAALLDPGWLDQPADRPRLDVIAANRAALVAAFPDMLHPAESWGDALSLPLLTAVHGAGVDRALLLLSDLYPDAPRPDVAHAAEELGYLLGRYDSYHSVHSPDAGPDATWATAQFDEAAYRVGRILNADGSGHAGFKGRGFHLSPSYAMPYVEQRVNGILGEMPQTAWFLDCDAAYEYFDDYHPDHPATRVQDVHARRNRARWLLDEHRLVLGSEGGCVLFSDLIAFGQGVHTPYIAHLDPAFRDPESPGFLGRHWPPDAPTLNFEPTDAPDAVLSPFFDPAVRIPLYRAALGDQLVTTHHWSFDSLKLHNVAATRGLLELLYLAAPTYHISRGALPDRIGPIARHVAFWSPLHSAWADSALTDFTCLTDDRLVQQTRFSHGEDALTITANFDKAPRAGLPARSVTVRDAGDGSVTTYVMDGPSP